MNFIHNNVKKNRKDEKEMFKKQKFKPQTWMHSNIYSIPKKETLDEILRK